MPLLFRVTFLAFLALLGICAVVLTSALALPAVAALRVATAVFFGLYGLIAAVLGGLLLADYRGSTRRMLKWYRAMTAPLPFLPAGSTGIYRALGGFFVIVGVVMAAVAWSGSISWKQ